MGGGGGGVQVENTCHERHIFKYLNLCLPYKSGQKLVLGDLLTEKLVSEKAALKEGGLISSEWSFNRCSAALDFSDLRTHHP